MAIPPRELAMAMRRTPYVLPYICAFPDGACYATEVKHLQWSDETSDLEPAFGSLTLELMHRMRWLSGKFQETSATFEFSDAVRALGNRTAVDFDHIRVRAASDYLQAQLPARDAIGAFELEGLGKVVFRHDPNPTALGFDFEAPSTDPRRDERRVRRVVNRAMQQIARHHHARH